MGALNKLHRVDCDGGEFWERYDPPVELIAAIKYRSSDIDDAGNGVIDELDDRVIHAVTTEFLIMPPSNRSGDEYLCYNSAKYPHDEYGPDGGLTIDGERPPITCKKCLSRMERWLDGE